MGIITIKAEEILAELNTNIRKVELCAFAFDDVSPAADFAVELPENSVVVFALVTVSGAATNIDLRDGTGTVYTETVASSSGVTFLKGSGNSSDEPKALRLAAEGESITADVVVYYTSKVAPK